MTETMKPDETRRRLIAGAGLAAASLAAGGMAAVPAQAKKSALWNFDTNNPEDAVKLYAKMAGSLVEQEVYLQYYGEIFSFSGRETPTPLVALKGLVRLRWTPGGDGTYSFSNYDHGLFCDYESGKVIDSYENPITGETNVPLHYHSGPLAAAVGLGEKHDNPMKKTWRINGNQIFVHNTRTSSFTNPVAPDKWGRASTGKILPILSSSTYLSDLREVADLSRDTVDSDHFWNFATGYPAWMLLGEKEGQVLWRWVARKFSNKAEIDPYILSEITDRVPGFLTDDKPWPERSDGWTQYTRERKPE